jgi:hypothetical protein
MHRGRAEEALPLGAECLEAEAPQGEACRQAHPGITEVLAALASIPRRPRLLRKKAP